MSKLLDKINSLQIHHQPVNAWDGIKYKPYIEKYVKLEDIRKILNGERGKPMLVNMGGKLRCVLSDNEQRQVFAIRRRGITVENLSDMHENHRNPHYPIVVAHFCEMIQKGHPIEAEIIEYLNDQGYDTSRHTT